MSRTDGLLSTTQPDQPVRRQRGGPPQPGIEIGADGTGTAVVNVARSEEVDDALADLGRKYKLPVELLEVTKVKAYGKPDDPMYSLHCNVRRALGDGETFAALMERVRKRRPRKRPVQTVGNRTLVAHILTDGQAGKGDPDRLMALWDDVVGHIEDRHRDLRKLGRPADTLYAPGGGDSTEGCGGNPNYPDQDRIVTLNESEQVEVATEMLDSGLDRFARLFNRVLTTTVSSNHDANRDGKNYPMGREDCRAFTIWRSVARAFKKNPDRYGHVEFWLPEDPDVATIDLHGIGVATIHGDLAARSPKGLDDKMWQWWSGQNMGGLPAGDCDVLNTAHFHHYRSMSQQGKRWIAHPALDIAGSKFFTDATGIWSYPGVFTYVVDENGVSDECLVEFTS